MGGNANYLRMARGAVHKCSFPIIREGSNIGNGLYLVSDNDFKSVLFLNNILPLEQPSSVKHACILMYLVVRVKISVRFFFSAYDHMG